MVDLLPIIIVVSLLAFFIALALVIFAWRAFTAAERRKTRRFAGNRGKREGPVRQMTLRNGKVIPLSSGIYGIGKDEYNSADLSTLRTGGSDKALEKPIPQRIPFTLTPLEKRPKLFGPRDSSPPSDLEAQTPIDPEKFEKNLKSLQLLNKHLLREPENKIIPQRQKSRRKWPGNHSNNANSKRITESLQKAYNVNTFSSRHTSQVSDYPLSPKSKPIPKHLRPPISKSNLADPSNHRVSKARSESIDTRTAIPIEQTKEPGRGYGRQGSGKSFSLPPNFPPNAVHNVQAVQVPPPVANVEVRSSKVRVHSLDGHQPGPAVSAQTTKSRNSRVSSLSTSRPHSGATSKRVSAVPSIPPLRLPKALKPPPPTPATTLSSLEKQQPTEVPKPLKHSPTAVHFLEATPKIESRQPRPPDIDVSAANARRRPSVVLDDGKTADSPQVPTPETEIHRPHDESARSTRSFATFASSDLSSAWTFGNAKRMPIFPSVAPRPVGTVNAAADDVGGFHVAPLRPKSKYGRKIKPTGMKALPVLPKSPLSPEDAV
ncbi:MAG: hypothetical protein Q9174_002616 [Haloplaca sp. 1 TL-2023]